MRKKVLKLKKIEANPIDFLKINIMAIHLF